MELYQEKGDVQILVKKEIVSEFNRTQTAISMDVSVLKTHEGIDTTHKYYFLMHDDVKREHVLNFCDGTNIEILGYHLYAKMLKSDCLNQNVPSFLGFDLPIFEGEFPNQTIVGSQPIKWIDFRPEVEKIFSPDNQFVIFPLDSPACFKGSEYARLNVECTYLTLLLAAEYTAIRNEWYPPQNILHN